jgi:hypothetical protein
MLKGNGKDDKEAAGKEDDKEDGKMLKEKEDKAAAVKEDDKEDGKTARC